MNVLILSSASEEIEDYYMSIARSVAHFLAYDGNDLVFGADSKSMMGICYEEFVKNGREIYGFTTSKYVDDLVNLPKAKPYIRETTFDMKKDMYQTCDFIVALPGGLGTLSEILSYQEENRSNDGNKPIIIYDEDGYYNKLFDFINLTIDKKFTSSESLSSLKIAHNHDEFLDAYNEVSIKKYVK